jgi:hypothetical protein
MRINLELPKTDPNSWRPKAGTNPGAKSFEIIRMG